MNVAGPLQQQFVDPTTATTNANQQLQQGPGILSRVKEGITQTVDPVLNSALCPESRGCHFLQSWIISRFLNCLVVHLKLRHQYLNYSCNMVIFSIRIDQEMVSHHHQ